MTIREELAAIRADGEGDKAKRIRRLKADRFIEELTSRLPLSWERGANVLTVTRARLGGRTGDDLELVVRLEHDGKNVRLNNPFVFVNPPILVPDAGGEVDLGATRGKFREDMQAAIRQAIEDAVETTVRQR